MSTRDEIEVALAGWREAERRLALESDGNLPALSLKAAARRADFQRLSSEYMMERIDALKDAERRRQESTPSTPPFHEAAREELEIAAEIWDEARRSDEETPRRAGRRKQASRTVRKN